MKDTPTLQKFFDFYSIVELYLKCGGFRDIGYQTYPVFVPYKIEERIRNSYEEIVNNFYEEIHSALITSIRSELRHFPNKAYNDPWEELQKHGIDNKSIKRIKRHPELYPRQAFAIFDSIPWVTSYGGKKWGKGVQLLIDSFKVKSLQEKIYWIDRVLDLYHNCGHMINKTKFKCLSLKKHFTLLRKTGTFTKYLSPLDFRAKAKNITLFLPHNSEKIKKLVIPRKNILDNRVAG